MEFLIGLALGTSMTKQRLKNYKSLRYRVVYRRLLSSYQSFVASTISLPAA